jgi:hypothetical protein
MNRSNYPEGNTMTIERLTRFAGFASIIAAVLIMASQFAGLFLLTSELPLSESIKSTPATLYNILKLSGFVLLLLGMVGLYVRQSVAGGMLGLIGFVVAFTGTVLVAGDWWFETFVVTWLVQVAPQALEVPPSGTLIVGGTTGFTLVALGWVLFGIVSFRARIFPRLASIVLILGGALGFQAGFPPFLVVLALGVGWMGFWLQKNVEVVETVPTVKLSVAE